MNVVILLICRRYATTVLNFVLTWFIIIGVLPTVFLMDYREMEKNAKQAPQRLLHLMKNYNERAKLKINEVTHIKSKSDRSPHFEAGYLVAEILESYRKMVGIIKHHNEFAIHQLFDIIKVTELLQKLFLEIYHLVNMFHEIARKYSHMPEFHIQEQNTREALEEAMRKLEENARQREREKKKRMKELKKQWQMYIKGISLLRPSPKPKPKNKYWPIDYGWEIDYYW